MIKRFTWFIGGAVAGITGAAFAKRKAKAVAADLAPVQVARRAGERVRSAIDEGKRAMRAKEAELRARREGRALQCSDERQVAIHNGHDDRKQDCQNGAAQ